MPTLLQRAEWWFRHSLVYPVLRALFRNPCVDLPIDPSTVRRLLILRYDRIGDMIVTTGVLGQLRTRFPDMHIGVVTSVSNAEILQGIPDVDDVYVLHKNWFLLFKEIFRARRNRYDVVLNFIFNRTTSGGVLANLIAPGGRKVGQGAHKYAFYFNAMVSLDRGSVHMAEILAQFVNQAFGPVVDLGSLRFSITVPDPPKERVDMFLNSQVLARRSAVGSGHQPYLVLNISAAERVRNLRVEQMVILARAALQPSTHALVVISAPGDRDIAVRLAHTIDADPCMVYPPEGRSSLLEVASLLAGAVGAITPDTSIIHFCSALNTPVLGLYTPLQVTPEWLPYRIPHLQVVAEPGQAVSDISDHRLTDAVRQFFSLLENLPMNHG